ncbi:MAG: biosynthetic-type acetolactate synthase large subunit, partial [Muribaculaceae bacterium]|nr:biosynthetic-type acetolactate synthase large subunit [Muribaculaceae bacterium]
MEDKITGSEILIRALADNGVDCMFGYPGGQIMPVYDKIYENPYGVKHYLARHEQGAIHAAEGYARATGRTGVVVTTSGPGAMNLLTGLADALMDSTPIVAISGQVGSALLGKDAFQESDVISSVLPVTKWALQVRRAEDIAPAVSRAFFIANSGRPGPVVIDLARDAQVGMAVYEKQDIPFIRSYDSDPEPEEGAIEEAAVLLNGAERPLVLAGHGIMISGAEKFLAALAEKGEIPVACTMLGLSCIPSDHPQYVGMLGMHGNLGPNINTNRADVILAVGMRFDDRVTGAVSKYAPDAKIIHIDIDASEFDKTVKCDLHVHSDAGKALKALLPLIGKKERKEWRASFDRHMKIEEESVMARELACAAPDGRMLMGGVIRKVCEAFGNDAVIVTDVGQNQMFSVRYSKFNKTRSLISSGGLGTMGYGLPAAIGAKIGVPQRPVVLFCGDGGLQMTVEELGMIMEYGVGVKIVLLNNNFLGNVRQWQHLFLNGRYSSTPMVNPDFRMLAQAYGIAAADVADASQLDAAIADMKAYDGAYLLNVNIDETDLVFPMTPGGNGVDEILLNESE